jgi:hypothetical protein
MEADMKTRHSRWLPVTIIVKQSLVVLLLMGVLAGLYGFTYADPNPFVYPDPEPAPAPTRQVLKFNPPTQWPEDFDDLVAKMDARFYRFQDCAVYTEYREPVLTWDQASVLSQYVVEDNGQAMIILDSQVFARVTGFSMTPGTIVVSENAMFGYLAAQVIGGNALVCERNGDTVMFGDAASNIVNFLDEHVR